MDQAIDGRGSGHGIIEDSIPLTKYEVAGDHETPTFVSFGEEGE